MSIPTLQAVLDWIWSGRSFHRMRDHVLHDGPVLEGLFEGVKGCLGDGVNGSKYMGTRTVTGPCIGQKTHY